MKWIDETDLRKIYAHTTRIHFEFYAFRLTVLSVAEWVVKLGSVVVGYLKEPVGIRGS
jgi:hypothetical protein